jgi:low affinity Fe/Cu permease
MWCANTFGTAQAFVTAAFILVLWAVSGPFLGFSTTRQLIINTGTGLVTFLAVFLIQNAQNRQSKAAHLKLDELLRGTSGARNRIVDLEDAPDAELKVVADEMRTLREQGNDA